jgi:glycogen debranching enzyme
VVVTIASYLYGNSAVYNARFLLFKHNPSTMLRDQNRLLPIASLHATKALFCSLLVLCVLPATAYQALPPAAVQALATKPVTLELSRAARPWEFLDAVGPRAGLFGSENGTMEAWVYPLKIFRDFRLIFHLRDRTIPAENFARTVIVRPESSTIVYSGDSFSVRETWFVPLNERGAVIRIEVDSREPLQIEAAFIPDFQLMWPAAIGGTYSGWDEKFHAFRFGHEQKKFFALIGSAGAAKSQESYVANYASSALSGFMLPPISSGRQTHVIAIAGSVDSQQQAEATYQVLLQRSAALEAEAAAHYREYLAKTVRLSLPDTNLQQAYDWSLLSIAKGMVTNPYLGTGLIAGYRTSGTTQRPGFAWFFGRDSLWTVLALDSAGDFASARTALDFLSKYQRADGKIEHEISQSATLVPWFKDFPYGYASADATPLYIIAMRDYAVSSGDVEFAKEKWDSIWKAYQFLRSTWDSNGMPQNINVGHGWVEGGPLLPVKTELYQSGLGTEALRALAEVGRLTGQQMVAGELEQMFVRQKARLNELFWSPQKRIFSFALDSSDRRVEIPSVLATVPMWFNVLEADKSNQMINTLADYDHAADWGMRIISSQDQKYDPAGYHFGSVWPLFTGWASVGEYKSHRATAAYANLQANAQLALDGSLGHVTEVLSGDNYVGLSTSSPHQIWSSAMVVSPVLRGLMGLEVSAPEHRLTFSPHVPAGWQQFTMENVRVGAAALDLSYEQSAEQILLRARRQGSGTIELMFSPAISPVTEVVSVEVNNRTAKFQLQPSAVDRHVQIRIPLSSVETAVRVNLRNSFGLETPVNLPELGEKSSALKIVSETWAGNRLSLQLSGIAAKTYEVLLYGGAKIASVDGAEVVEDTVSRRLRVKFPAGEGYVKKTVSLAFARK